MSIEIRNVPPDEFASFLEVNTTAFLERPDIARAVEWARSRWEPARTWGAFDGGRVCGTFRSWPTELTVPGGGRLPVAAVTGVTVLPTHRRRGILTALMTAGHAAIRERGEAVGLLHASEYGIYGRFGYGPGSRVATWTLDTAATGFHGAPVAGVDMVPANAEARDAIRGVFEAWRARQAGEIRRHDFRWDTDLGLADSPWHPAWKGFLALHRDSTGVVDGYVRYQAEEKWEQRQPRCLVKVDELHALTDEADHALWRFLAEIDLVAKVIASGRSPSDRLPWLLTNARAAVASDIGEDVWVRLFDVARALEARSYERTGSLVLEVVDGELDAPIRVALDASPDGATCRPTDRPPDLTLRVAALGAAYLGGTRLRDAVIATGVDEHREGALGDADNLFRTADEPWCSTGF
jgi:predicted acetyltransferase